MSENDDVLVTVPFSRLLKLLEPNAAVTVMEQNMQRLEKRCEQLQREIMGLHRTNTELMVIVGDLRRGRSDSSDD